MSLYFSQKALLDLKEIYIYSMAQWSVPQAEKYYFEVIETCRKIEVFPTIGKLYSNVFSQPRGFKVQKHIIYYKIEKGKIKVIRILHESQDLKRVF
ncbi:MAG: hypothetical protein RLZZ65_503 [Bacteroidota bacterium]|jgi:toxin ParE1/3/4